MKTSNNKITEILDSEIDISDKHYEIRGLFFKEIEDDFNQYDMIHMDCVSDAVDNLLSGILEYVEKK